MALSVRTAGANAEPRRIRPTIECVEAVWKPKMLKMELYREIENDEHADEFEDEETCPETPFRK
jgi:hypothetical protein